MKKNKGITLIVLVITIIVMSILIGVSIRLVAGKKGLIARSKTTKEETLRQQALEVIEKEVRSSIDELGEYDINEAIENINSNYSERITELVQSTDKRIGLKFKHQDYEFSFVISNKGEVTAVSEYIYEKETSEEDIYELLAPVPIGFVASDYIGTNDGEEEVVDVITKQKDETEEYIIDIAKLYYDGEDKIEYGLVIYEGDKKVDESNLSEAKTTRNQFVWIPVKEEDLNSLLVADENGDLYYKYLEEYDLSLSHNKINKTIGGKYAIVIEPYFKFTYTNKEKEKENLKDFINEISEERIEEEYNRILRNDFNNMINSIKKFGGFFVARYEASNYGNDVIKGKDRWHIQVDWFDTWKILNNSINKENKYYNNKSFYTNMLYGVQMRLIANFIDKKVVLSNESDTGYKYFYSDLKYNEVQYIQEILDDRPRENIEAGMTELARVLNIYDLVRK